jgi:TolB-like protein/Flp pilus assembly protein TadD
MSQPTFVGRFGAFSLDAGQFELRRDGRTVKLERQAMELLILLVERRGRLVSRPEIVRHLWGDAVFVDVDTGVNTAISKIRQALRDSAEAPTFIETVQGKGYRFIAPVEAVSGPPTTAATIAVLPFENLTSVPDSEYLAAGLTEETSASLAQIDPAHLSVRGRTLRYKGTTKTVAEIGHELSVDYLVASSIRAEGIRLRVTVILIRVSDQEHVWSQSYEREATSLLGLQQELSEAIAQQIRLRLSPDRINGLGRRQTKIADAYDTYLRARFQAHRRTADGNARAIELYKRAIEIDPGYALAWADLAFTYAGACINGDAPPAVAGPRAREAAQKAVEANSNLSEAQLALGYGLWLIDWKWQASEAALQRAVDIDPSNVAAFRILGHALSQSGQHDKAAAAMRRSCELDPVDGLSRALSSQVAFQARDVAAAGDHARHAIALEPGLWIGHIELAQAYDGAGDHELALQAVADAVRFSGGNSKAVALRGYILARMGRVDAVREVMRGLDSMSNERYVPPFAMALVCAGLGDREAMFDFLDKAFAARDVHLMYLPVDMKWDTYRTDRRFGDLLVRCGFASSP